MGDAVVVAQAAPATQFKASTSGLSKTWSVAKSHTAAYTGGKVQIAGDGTVAAAQSNDGVAFLDLETGQVRMRVQHAVAVSRVVAVVVVVVVVGWCGGAVEVVCV